jgi:hypothetical protein
VDDIFWLAKYCSTISKYNVVNMPDIAFVKFNQSLCGAINKKTNGGRVLLVASQICYAHYYS